MPPSKRRRLVTTVQGQVDAFEKFLKTVSSSTGEANIKVAPLQGMQRRLQSSFESITGLAPIVEGDEAKNIAELTVITRAILSKADSLIKVAKALHPEDGAPISHSELFASIQMCQVVLGGFLPPSFLLTLCTTCVEECLEDQAGFEKVAALISAEPLPQVLNVAALTGDSGDGKLDEAQASELQMDIVRECLGAILKSCSEVADSAFELHFLQAVSKRRLAPSVGALVCALANLLNFASATSSTKLRADRKIFQDDTKATKLFNGNRRGLYLAKKIHQRVSTCLEDECHKKTVLSLQRRVAGEEAPPLEDFVGWAEIYAQLVRVRKVTSAAFQQTNLAALGEIDCQLDRVRSSIENKIGAEYTKALGDFLQLSAKARKPDMNVKASDLLPALRLVLGTLKSSEVSDFAKVSDACRVAEFDKQHEERSKFCEALAKVLPLAFFTGSEVCDTPDDGDMENFIQSFGVGNAGAATPPAFLGGVPMDLWVQARAVLCEGMDCFWRCVCDSLDIRPELIAYGVKVVKSSTVKNLKPIPEETARTLPKACDLMDEILQRVLKVGHIPGTLADNISFDEFVLAPAMAFAHHCVHKLKAAATEKKLKPDPDQCRDVARVLALARLAEDSLSKMQRAISKLPDTFLCTKEKAQAYQSQMSEDSNDCLKHILETLRVPLVALAEKVDAAVLELSIVSRVDQVVTQKAEEEWGSSLLQIARGQQGKSVLGLIAQYDDNLSLATQCFKDFSATFADTFKGDAPMQRATKMVAHARSAIALCNLLQCMYKKYPSDEARASSVKDALQTAPKSGPIAAHKKLCEVANRMLS